jgi:hypothetical protein
MSGKRDIALIKPLSLLSGVFRQGRSLSQLRTVKKENTIPNGDRLSVQVRTLKGGPAVEDVGVCITTAGVNTKNVTKPACTYSTTRSRSCLLPQAV